MNEEFRHNLLQAETTEAVTAYLRKELGTAASTNAEPPAPEPSVQPQTP